MLHELNRALNGALSGALAESSDLHEMLRRLHAEGYGLIILVDRRDAHGSVDPGPDSRGSEQGGSPFGLPSSRMRLVELRSPVSAGSRPEAAAREGRSRSAGEPSFRIDGADLAFLRSIGIDPTRKVRGRKPRPRGDLS